MATQGHVTVDKQENKLTLSRVYAAPKELVFSMFSNPEHLAKWWGPTTWPATITTFEFKPGGTWHYYMQGPDGTKAWGKSIFKAIDEPHSFSYIDMFSDEHGTVNETLPKGDISVWLEEVDGMTTLNMEAIYNSAEEVEKLVEMGMLEGMKDTWNQLEVLIGEQTKNV